MISIIIGFAPYLLVSVRTARALVRGLFLCVSLYVSIVANRNWLCLEFILAQYIDPINAARDLPDGSIELCFFMMKTKTATEIGCLKILAISEIQWIKLRRKSLQNEVWKTKAVQGWNPLLTRVAGG